MSSKASFTPNRSARARALGRSMSQMASTSTVRIFLSTGRCATWAMAPPPMTPTLSRSPAAALRPAVIVLPSSSVAPSQAGAGKVGRQNLRVPLPRPSSADGAPLTETHTVSRSLAVNREMRHPPASAADSQGERVAPKQLAVRRPKHLPDGETIDPHLGPAHCYGELIDSTGWCAPRHPDIAHLPDQLLPNAGDRRKVPLQGGPKRLITPLLMPAVARRDAAIRYSMLVFVGDGTQIRLSRAMEDFHSLGCSPPARRIEERLRRRAVVGHQNAARSCDGRPALWRLEQDSAVHLIGDAGGQIISVGLPSTHVAQRVRPRHHCLGLQRRLLVRVPMA